MVLWLTPTAGGQPYCGNLKTTKALGLNVPNTLVASDFGMLRGEIDTRVERAA
jgi:hypothetical protein